MTLFLRSVCWSASFPIGNRYFLFETYHNMVFPVRKKYIIDVEKSDQQKFKCATQVWELLYYFLMI